MNSRTSRQISWLTLGRLYRGYSQRELAERAGFEQTQISRLESGNRRPRPKTVKRLADALDLPGDRLFPSKGSSAMEMIAGHFELDRERKRMGEARRRAAREAARPPRQKGARRGETL